MNTTESTKVAVSAPSLAPLAAQHRNFNIHRGRPLPQRWRRAKAWAARNDCPRLDPMTLKLMLLCEAEGRG